MTTDARTLHIAGMPVAVVRKPIKNLHLGVYPPDGKVRVAAPLEVSDAAVRVAVVERLRWIRHKREAFERQARQSAREYVSGETHYLFGQRYRLRVVEAKSGPHRVTVRGKTILELSVRPGTDRAGRERAMLRFYRDRLEEMIPPLLQRWEQALGVRVEAWQIRRMKTRWGGCNPAARRIWLNLELAKKPPHCLEYLIVHELAHLLVPHHDDRFVALMDRHLPKWRSARQDLNAAPLSHETWSF